MGKMKKDKKWFIDKWTKERNKTDVHDPMYHFINEFIADVSQIDEPEVLSEEWLDENKSSWTKLKVDGYYIPVEKLQNLLVPKQELPVIPEYVADWIKEEQGTMSNWKLPSRFISDSKYKKDQRRYKWSQVEGNMDKFMSALINSYEVEEEPLYYALIKGHELIDSGFKYWTCHTRNQRGAFVGRKILYSSKYKTVLPISVWDDFGLNDSNADFIKVEE